MWKTSMAGSTCEKLEQLIQPLIIPVARWTKLYF